VFAKRRGYAQQAPANTVIPASLGAVGLQLLLKARGFFGLQWQSGTSGSECLQKGFNQTFVFSSGHAVTWRFDMFFLGNNLPGQYEADQLTF